MGRPRGRPKKVQGQGAVASAEIRHEGDAEGAPRVESFSGAEEREDKQFIGEMGDLLESRYYTMNKLIPELRQALGSVDPRNWYVKWFFANAEDGPIYVDYPRNKHELEWCQRKAPIMEKSGMKYRLFRPEEDERLQRATASIEAEAEIPAGEVF